MSTDAVKQGRFDLSNWETFKGETLNWAEARGRQKVLAVKDRVELSPRSGAELDQLDKVLDPSRVVIGPVEVEGRYSVVIHPNPEEATIRAVNETAEKLQAMQRALPNNSEIEVLRVLTSSSEDMAWYRGLYEKSSITTQVFRNFTEAKLHLLAALKHFPKTIFLSKSVKQFYEQLCVLHQKWIEENKNCASAELSEVNRCLLILEQLYRLFLNHNVNDQKKQSDFFIPFVQLVHPLTLPTQREHFIQDFYYEIGNLTALIEVHFSLYDPWMKGVSHLGKAISLLKSIESNLFQLLDKQAHAEGIKEIKKLQTFALPNNHLFFAATNYFGLLLKRAVQHQLNAVVAQRESRMFECIRKEEQALEESEDILVVLKELEDYQSEEGLVSRNKITLKSILDQRIKEIE